MIGLSKALVAALSAVGLAGTGWIAYGWVDREGEADPAPVVAVATPPQPEEQLESAPLALPPAQAFVEIVRRPIFSPDRRPAPEGELTLETAAANLDVNLVGIIIASGEPIALIAPRGSATLQRLGQGDRYQGWTVDRIEANGVRFRRDGAVHDVEISYDRPPTVVPTPTRPTLRERAPEPSPQQTTENERQ